MVGVAQKQQSDGNSAQRVAEATGKVVRVTPTVLNADAYDSGDVLFTMTEVPEAVDAVGGYARIEQIVIYDQDDQTAAAWVLYFGAGSTTLAAPDAAPSISDANAIGASAGLGLRGLAVASAAFLDAGGLRIATLSNLGLIVQAAAASRSVYVGAVVTGTPTQATGGIVMDIYFA
jgi:hypothetical protein